MSSNPYQTPESNLTEEKEVESGSELNLASRGQRLGASLLDGITLSLINGVFIYFYLGFDDILALTSLENQVALGIFGIIAFLLINGMLIYKSGQTLGKKIVGIRVVDLEGVQVSGNTYLLKRLLPFWIAGYIPLIGPWVSLINVLLIFRKEHNCLHDDIASTRVIKL